MKREKLSLKTLLGYGLGDLYGGGAMTIISMYYFVFLVEVVGINPALAGTAFLVSKLWDAVTDPFMGIISDNTRTKWGRRRPYFFAGIFLIFVSFALMWTPMPIKSQGMAFVFYLGAYLFFSTIYTMVWVPYQSIAAELTPDYDERTKLSTFRMVFSNLAGVLGATLSYDLFVIGLNKDDPAHGYFIMGICFGLFFALPYILTFLWCKEDPEFMNEPKKKIGSLKSFVRSYFIEPLSIKPFRNVTMMYLFGFMASDAVMMMALIFMKYYLKINSMMTLLVPVFGSMIIAIILLEVLQINRALGKKNTFILSCIIWLGAFSTVFFMKPGMDPTLLTIFGIFFGIGNAGIQVMVFAMFPDIPDVDELFTNQRREGTFSGFFAFLRKAGGAFLMFIIGISLDLAGYLEPLEKLVDGKLVKIDQVQSDSFLFSLLLLFTLIPSGLVLIAMIACMLYPLSKSVHERLRGFLVIQREARHKGIELTEEQKAEALELKRMLGDKNIAEG